MQSNNDKRAEIMPYNSASNVLQLLRLKMLKMVTTSAQDGDNYRIKKHICF